MRTNHVGDLRRRIAGVPCWMFLLLAWLPAGPAFAQHEDGESGDALTGVARQEASAMQEEPQQEEGAYPSDSTLPRALRQDYALPDPNLPGGYRQSPPVSRYYQRGGRPYGWGRYSARPYSYDYGYGSYWRYLDPYDPYLFERVYRQGVTDGRWFEQYERELELGLNTYLKAFEFGHEAFSKGEYDRAARGYLLAARQNQGDPASRLCAGNALIALGRYDDAAQMLRRAFELQPRMAYLPLDIRDEYGQAEDFHQHLSKVKTAAEAAEAGLPSSPGSSSASAPTPVAAGAADASAAPAAPAAFVDCAERKARAADLWALAGYMMHFSGRSADAADALDRAARLTPQDDWIRTLHDAARMTAPAR
ncbi:MAG: hypothetical protein FLDDKLPJ_02764 [Phycisphaerae bacterium]|nr:hypothetical protein [Phycisphaerae bacterium]